MNLELLKSADAKLFKVSVQKGTGVFHKISEFAKLNNMTTYPLITKMLSPDDVLGTPFFDKSSQSIQFTKTEFESSLKQLSLDSAKVILVLDELEKAMPEVKKMLSNLINNHPEAIFTLPDNCVIVVAEPSDTQNELTHIAHYF
jgi:hypothetical protein